MIETTQGNIGGKGFSKREILGAKLARKVQGRIRQPPSDRFNK